MNSRNARRRNALAVSCSILVPSVLLFAMSIRVSKDSLPAGTVMAPVTPIEQLVATKPSAELDADVYLNDR